jgi:hypothetical protein
MASDKPGALQLVAAEYFRLATEAETAASAEDKLQDRPNDDATI